MKHDPKESLGRLWTLARQRAAPEAESDAALPSGLSTKIAARWAEKPARSELLRRWERVTACAFVSTLALCGAAALTRPEPVEAAEEDLLLTLFHARVIEPKGEPDLPF